MIIPLCLAWSPLILSEQHVRFWRKFRQRAFLLTITASQCLMSNLPLTLTLTSTSKSLLGLKPTGRSFSAVAWVLAGPRMEWLLDYLFVVLRLYTPPETIRLTFPAKVYKTLTAGAEQCSAWCTFSNRDSRVNSLLNQRLNGSLLEVSIITRL